jgi:hypothetical protein
LFVWYDFSRESVRTQAEAHQYKSRKKAKKAKKKKKKERKKRNGTEEDGKKLDRNPVPIKFIVGEREAMT